MDIPASTATTRTRANHTKKLRHISPWSDAYKFSFFPRTIPVCNSLTASVAEPPDLVSFKQRLSTQFLSLGRGQSVSGVMKFSELCRLCDHTQWQLLYPDWSFHPMNHDSKKLYCKHLTFSAFLSPDFCLS